jgi:hypothetical protein
MTSRLPILALVSMVYRDVWRVLLTMRMLVLTVLLIVLALNVAEELVPVRVWGGPVLGSLLGFAMDAVRSFCLTPFMIAVHRFILRDEVTRHYAPDPSQPGFMVFFGWLVVLSAVGTLALVLQEVLSAISLSPFAGLVVAAFVIIAVGLLSLRLSILFPAIAIEARGATAANVLADTKGHALRIFLIFLLALLPCMVVAIGVTLMLGRGVTVPGTPAAVFNLVAGAAIQIVALCLGVAIASRVFEALADRVLRAG